MKEQPLDIASMLDMNTRNSYYYLIYTTLHPNITPFNLGWMVSKLMKLYCFPMLSPLRVVMSLELDITLLWK